MRREVARSNAVGRIDEDCRRLRRFLCELRRSHGLSQFQAAAKACIDEKTYGRIERGEFMPRYSTLLQIAAGYEMSQAEFHAALSEFCREPGCKPRRLCTGKYYSPDGRECIEIWKTEAPVKRRT